MPTVKNVLCLFFFHKKTCFSKYAQNIWLQHKFTTSDIFLLIVVCYDMAELSFSSLSMGILCRSASRHSEPGHKVPGSSRPTNRWNVLSKWSFGITDDYWTLKICTNVLSKSRFTCSSSENVNKCNLCILAHLFSGKNASKAIVNFLSVHFLKVD